MKFNVTLTASKILAYIVFFTCSAYAFICKDSQVMSQGVLYSVILMGVKTGVNGLVDVSKNKK